jgi:hypothetical protein
VSPIKNPLLHRFWIESEPDVFDNRLPLLTIYSDGVPHKVPRAVGVTAFTLDDALFLVDDELFSQLPRPPLRRILEDFEATRLPDLALHAGLPTWAPELNIRRATTVWRGI